MKINFQPADGLSAAPLDKVFEGKHMGKEKIFKRHDNRKDLAGEHKFGDLGQIIFLLIFLVVWVVDSFFVKFSTHFSGYAPLYIRIPLAIVILIIAGYLARQGLTIVFAEVREEPMVIRKGVFSVVRHPIYLGAILFYLSLLAAFFSMISAIVWVIIILFYIYLCKHEEKLLIEIFGSDYERYKMETPMLLPIKIQKKV
jgi:protein-S-isoprenylcysteine O-methyltransferase Ste14